MTVRIPTSHRRVLQAVLDRAIQQIEWCQKSNCILSLDRFPPEESRAIYQKNRFLTVAPDSGQFDQGVHEGAGIVGTFEYSAVVITAFSRMKQDPTGSADAILLDQTWGMLEAKRDLLKAFSGHDLQGDARVSGSALEETQILVNLMAPVQASFPGYGYHKDFAHTSVIMSIDFEWDLS